MDKLIKHLLWKWVKREIKDIKPIYEGYAMKVIIENNYGITTSRGYLLPRVQKYKIIAIPIE